MVRRSSTTSRGTTYWFHRFCFPMSRVSGLRVRNFDVLTKIKRRKGNKAIKERTSSIPDPSLHGFQHGSGLKADNTTVLKERSVFALFIYLYLLIKIHAFVFYSHFQIFLLSRRSRSHLGYIRKIIIIIMKITIITETENNDDQLW